MNIEALKAKAIENGYTIFPFVKPSKTPKYWCEVRLNHSEDQTAIRRFSGKSAAEAEDAAWKWAGQNGRRVTSTGSAARELAQMQEEKAKVEAELAAMRSGSMPATPEPDPEPEPEPAGKTGDLASAKVAASRKAKK